MNMCQVQNQNSNEKWKTIKEFENYMISNLGRVFSKRNNIILKQAIDKDKYFYIKLNKRGKYHKYIHRLVAEYFVDGYFKDAHVDHIDGNRQNNNAFNLEWVTPRENAMRGKLRDTNKYSKFIGVTWDRHIKKWRSQIIFDNKHYHLFCSDDESICAKVYNDALKAIEGNIFYEFLNKLNKDKIKNQISQYKGVTLDKRDCTFYCQISFNKKHYLLIRSKNEELCSDIYQEAVKAKNNNEFEDFMSNLVEFKKYTKEKGE